MTKQDAVALFRKLQVPGPPSLETVTDGVDVSMFDPLPLAAFDYVLNNPFQAPAFKLGIVVGLIKAFELTKEDFS